MNWWMTVDEYSWVVDVFGDLAVAPHGFVQRDSLGNFEATAVRRDGSATTDFFDTLVDARMFVQHQVAR